MVPVDLLGPELDLGDLLMGFESSQLKESMSRQNASLSSTSVVLVGSMDDRRLLLRVSLGDMVIVASSVVSVDVSSSSFSFVPYIS